MTYDGGYMSLGDSETLVLYIISNNQSRDMMCLLWVNLIFNCIIHLMVRICDALRDLVPFVQIKKREKDPWRSVNFSKVAGFILQLY